MAEKNSIGIWETAKYKALKKQEQSTGKKDILYSDVLKRIQKTISTKHSQELAASLFEPESESKLKTLIRTYLFDLDVVIHDLSLEELTERIYQDMAGTSFLKPYLASVDVEEININGPNEIWVHYSDHKVLIPERFSSTQECVAMVKKLCEAGGLILDNSMPCGDSYISKGERISAVIAPAVDPEVGATASIRKQMSTLITRAQLVEFGTASEMELDFLEICLNSGISIGIAGSTGSGKTVDMNYILSTIPDDVRVVTIEDTKELYLTRRNKEGQQRNDLVQLYTKEEPNPVTMYDLVKTSLRLHPKILVPAEMRGAEAKEVVETLRTGHSGIASLHAKNARKAYGRILSMYLGAGTETPPETVLENIVEAFPIMVFKRQLEDKSRKYMEIFEATGTDGMNVIGNTLFRFRHEKTIKENGQVIRVEGVHEQVAGISDQLAEDLRLSGVEESIIRKFQMKEEIT